MHYTNYIIHYLIVLVFPELLLDKTVFDVYQQHYVVYSTVLVFLTAFLILCYNRFFDLFIHFVHLICSVNDIHDVQVSNFVGLMVVMEALISLAVCIIESCGHYDATCAMTWVVLWRNNVRIGKI